MNKNKMNTFQFPLALSFIDIRQDREVVILHAMLAISLIYNGNIVNAPQKCQKINFTLEKVL